MILEAVPNFSEGRRQDVCESFAAAAASVPGVRVLDLEMDRDHNRSVLTFVGEPDPVAEASFLCARKAVEQARNESGPNQRHRLIRDLFTPRYCILRALNHKLEKWISADAPLSGFTCPGGTR